MNHLSSLQLSVYLDDAALGAPDSQTTRHIASCAMCRARYEAWCHVDDSLRELLGHVPDEHAMEQRTSWVEIAVSAERKGLPAPEFAELRIPLAAPSPTSMMRALTSPPPRPAPSVPVRITGPIPTAAAPAATPPPRTPLRPPVLHAPAPPPPPVHAPAPAYSVSPVAPSAAPPPPVVEHHAKPETAPVHEPAPTAKAARKKDSRKQGYARMPNEPRRGFAALLSRPVFWLVLMLFGGLAAAVPAAYKRYGLPEIKLSFPGRDGGKASEASDRDKGSGRSTARDKEGTVVKRTKSSGSSPSRASVNDEPPDASILFDLPALEPEDGEPDPVETASPPKKSTSSSATAKTDQPMLVGEVRTPQGMPIEGARVSLTVPSKVVRTDRRGHFSILCPPGKRTLRVEATGRVPVTRELKLGRERLETRFTLQPVH